MTNPVTPTPPAGWYPDGSNASIQRYWDGIAWTEHTAPNSVPAPAPVSVPASGAQTEFVATQPAYAQAGSGYLPPKKRLSAGKIALISGGGVLAVLLIISIAVGAAAGGGAKPAEVALVTPATPAAANTPTATPPPVLTEAPAAVDPSPVAPPAVDPEFFRTSATRDMDDMSKDLDDMIVAVDEAGTFRILSNSVEIEFNLAQLTASEAPASTSAEWAAGLVAMAVSTTALSEAISNDDYSAIRIQVDAIRGQLGVLRDIVSRTV